MSEHAHSAGTQKGSGGLHKGLLLLIVIMFGIAVLTFGPSLTLRDAAVVFIPVWLFLTVSVVFICMWFVRNILTAEKARDSETPSPHSH
jgi:hypothetical protein